MSYLISFNSSKLINNGFNNIFEHQFPVSVGTFKDCEIAVHSITMYNSIFNIDSSAYGNNSVTIIMPTGSTTSTINITFPDGLYSYNDMTRYIQSVLVSFGAYLIDDKGNNVHYIKLSENATYYAAQLDCSPLPTTLPTNWVRPATGLYSSGGSGLPTTTRVPILNVTNTNFGKLIGFSTAQYPATSQTTLQSFLSNLTPTIHPVGSYMLRCSLINNPYNIPTDVLTTFDTQGTGAGQLISYKPNEYSWIPVSDGSYSNIRLTIVDQDERYVRIRDPNMLITIAVKQQKK